MDPLILLSIIAAAIVVMIISACFRISLPASGVIQFLKQIENNGSPDLPARSDWDEEIVLDSRGTVIIPLSDSSKPRLSFK